MKVLVAGASGAIGEPLLRALRTAGHEVTALTRTEAGAQRLRAAGATPVVADVMDRERLLRALDGATADAVIHEATAFRELRMGHKGMAASNALRITGTANLIEAALLVGAHRFLAQSMIYGYGYGDHGSRLLTEDDPFAPAGRTGAVEQHLHAMRSLEQQTFGADGLDGISLRYGLFYGRDLTIGKMVDALRKRRLPIPRGGGGVGSFIYLEDAAAATVAALERGRAGEAYNVVDDEPASWREFLSALAAAFGAPPPRELPLWLFRRLGYVGVFMTSVVRVSNAKARRELGFSPLAPTYRDGIRLLAG
jgi:nucleoside-diphosphate-sugar epimerase